MVYIVSGFQRTGTSMMMRAMEAGGLPVIHDDVREQVRKGWSDENYEMNPVSLYELPACAYRRAYFPFQYDDDICIKVLCTDFRTMHPLTAGKVIFMWRDFEEIRQSFRAASPSNAEWSIPRIDEITSSWKLALTHYSNLQVLHFWYSDVIENPLLHMRILELNDWPIDPEKAAAVVDSRKYRFRKDKLVVGL